MAKARVDGITSIFPVMVTVGTYVVKIKARVVGVAVWLSDTATVGA